MDQDRGPVHADAVARRGRRSFFVLPPPPGGPSVPTYGAGVGLALQLLGGVILLAGMLVAVQSREGEVQGAAIAFASFPFVVAGWWLNQPTRLQVDEEGVKQWRGRRVARGLRWGEVAYVRAGEGLTMVGGMWIGAPVLRIQGRRRMQRFEADAGPFGRYGRELLAVSAFAVSEAQARGIPFDRLGGGKALGPDRVEPRSPVDMWEPRGMVAGGVALGVIGTCVVAASLAGLLPAGFWVHGLSVAGSGVILVFLGIRSTHAFCRTCQAPRLFFGKAGRRRCWICKGLEEPAARPRAFP